MKLDDKVKHIEGAQKELTSLCFDACFSTKKFVVDKQCMTTCYDKYIFAANHVRKELEEQGRECRSDFIGQSIGLEDPRSVFHDRFSKTIFPKNCSITKISKIVDPHIVIVFFMNTIQHQRPVQNLKITILLIVMFSNI